MSSAHLTNSQFSAFQPVQQRQQQQQQQHIYYETTQQPSFRVEGIPRQPVGFDIKELLQQQLLQQQQQQQQQQQIQYQQVAAYFKAEDPMTKVRRQETQQPQQISTGHYHLPVDVSKAPNNVQQPPQQQPYMTRGGVMFGLETHQFVGALDRLLSHAARRGDQIPYDSQYQLLTAFHQRPVPTVSIRRYLERIMKYAHCSDECYVLALVYLERITGKNKNFHISSFNVHRLLITAVMEAIKFFDDRYYNNAHYARVGGVSCQEINALEAEFLSLMDFDLHVTPSQFEFYKNAIITCHNNSIRPPAPAPVSMPVPVDAATPVMGATTPVAEAHVGYGHHPVHHQHQHPQVNSFSSYHPVTSNVVSSGYVQTSVTSQESPMSADGSRAVSQGIEYGQHPQYQQQQQQRQYHHSQYHTYSHYP